VLSVELGLMSKASIYVKYLKYQRMFLSKITLALLLKHTLMNGTNLNYLRNSKSILIAVGVVFHLFDDDLIEPNYLGN